MIETKTQLAGSLRGLVKRRCDQTFAAHIDSTHPMSEDAPVGAVEADALAMQLVGERHAKRDLVDLVRWLILRNPDGLLSTRK